MLQLPDFAAQSRNLTAAVLDVSPNEIDPQLPAEQNNS
jgi:hypothetical protein